jgi:riboflavin synthase
VFTGLIADLGTVERVDRGADGARMRIATELAADIADGDSVAVNGVCLTAAARGNGSFEADVMNQTLTVTSLAPLESGDHVNLELAVRAGDRLGGHLVQGHVDAAAAVMAVQQDGFARRVEIELADALRPYVVERGSVAVDGVSLTVAGLTGRGFEVSLIPETLERTTLGRVQEGTIVNIEVDQVARYVEQAVSRFRSNDE